MTLTSTLTEAPTRELLRAYNSEKAYLYFDISVFNVGASINIICTDQFKQPSARTCNGYNFLIENDDTTKFYILWALADRRQEGEHQATPAQLKKINSIVLKAKKENEKFN